VTVIVGDCREVMAGMAEASVDAVVCDPPYGLEFMGKDWDKLNASKPGNDAFKPKRSTMTWDPEAKATKSNPWATERSSYGTRRKNPRCYHCGRLKMDKEGRKCVCAEPYWNPRRDESAREMQDWHETWAREAFRVLKPGGHLLAFGGTRTFHRMTVAIEDAGFEIRDCLSWLYGSGFPKSLDVSKAIDKRRDDAEPMASVSAWLKVRLIEAGWNRQRLDEWSGIENAWQKWTTTNTDGAFRPRVPTWEQWVALREAVGFGNDMDAEVWRLNGRKGQPGEAWHEREVIGTNANVERAARITANGEGAINFGAGSLNADLTAPATPEAEHWAGWGTALKPAWEPVIVARKPLVGTVAANVLAHGTGALNIDGTRIQASADDPNARANKTGGHSGVAYGQFADGTERAWHGGEGRWPATVALDEAAAALLDAQSGVSKSPKTYTRNADGFGNTSYRVGEPAGKESLNYGDTGGASRFFLVAPIDDPDADLTRFAYVAKSSRRERNAGLPDGETCTHPTVKPIALMRWLVRLVTPPGGLVCETCYNRQYETSTTPNSSASSVPDMRHDVQAQRQHEAGQVLLDEMQVRGAEEANVQDVRGLRRRVPAGQTVTARQVLQQELRVESNLSEVGQGLRNLSEGLQTSLPSGASDGEQTGLRHGAPARDGGASGTQPQTDRGRASQERTEVRQPDRESGTDDQSQARPNPQAAAEADHLPTLRREDQGFGSCPTCGGPLTRRPGVVLDPFAGSGSTGCACLLEGFDFIGIEQDAEYAQIAERRIAFWQANGDRPVTGRRESHGRSVSATGLKHTPPTCPTHAEILDRSSHPRRYKCGCPRASEPYPQRPTILQPALPLEGVAD
jgi:DNA modification methylase